MIDTRVSFGGVLRRGRPWYAEWFDHPLGKELGPALVRHAVELVELARGADDEIRTKLIEVVLASLVAQQHGSTRIPAPDSLVELVESGQVADLLSLDPTKYRPLLATDGWLYHQRTFHYEQELARLLHHRMGREVVAHDALSSALDDVCSNPTKLRDGTPVVLSDEQRAAVQVAALRPLSVITGGPGTGKTSIVVSLLRLLVRLGVAPDRIVLAAPTGKAANRLGESIETQLVSLEAHEADTLLREQRNSPSTLHRLLKYSGARGRFLRDESDPIDADWVIVDEASMIDLVLMERLVRCVADPSNLVLLGDVQQLPSVETGTILRDLIPTGDGPHVSRLRKSFRMDERDPAGRAILSLAGLVRDGATESIRESLSEGSPGVRFLPAAPAELRNKMIAFVDRWFADRVLALDDFQRLARQSYVLCEDEFDPQAVRDIDRLFQHFERFRILTLTRVYATGADALNQAFHLRMARRFAVDGLPEFVGGEPVMMLRNDYERGLFNGDQGLVLWVDSGDSMRPAAVFPTSGGYRAHHLSGLSGQLAHSWAMTVHKSQGSEFDDVAMILPEEDIPLLSRELLYTGITRARRSVEIIGPEELLLKGASRSVERWTGLSERLFGQLVSVEE